MAKDKRTYWEKLKDPRWQKVRLQVLERAKFRCEVCGSTERTLHVHHGAYIKNHDPWEYTPDMLHCLCEWCHEAAEYERFHLHWTVAQLPVHVLDQLVLAAIDLLRDNPRTYEPYDEQFWEDVPLGEDGRPEWLP